MYASRPLSLSSLLGDVFRAVFEQQIEEHKRYRVVLTSVRRGQVSRSFVGEFIDGPAGPSVTYVPAELAGISDREAALEIAFRVCVAFGLWGRIRIEEVQAPAGCNRNCNQGRACVCRG